jgi:hypothetical protein
MIFSSFSVSYWQDIINLIRESKEEESAIEVICRFDYYKYWFQFNLHMLKAEIDITEGNS